MAKRDIIYYSDELNEEFSTAKIEPIKIDGKYKYTHNKLWDICSLCMQNVISMPIKIIYAKLWLKIKFVGREKFKKCKEDGFYVYANHTQPFADTFIPSLAAFPRRNFFIVNPENVSIKPFGKLIEMLGAIPVPSNMEAMRNFRNIIKEKNSKKSVITIYPEAHIWPYYTKIRPFKSVSFTYPVQQNKPTFCITNTYQRHGKLGNKFKMVSYIDGPFWPNENIKNEKDRKQELRDRVYECMVNRSKNSNIEIIKYIKR